MAFVQQEFSLISNYNASEYKNGLRYLVIKDSNNLIITGLKIVPL